MLDELIKNNVSIFYEASQETTVFENIYPEGLDLRVQNVKCVAQPFSAQDIPPHLSPFIVPLFELESPMRARRILLLNPYYYYLLLDKMMEKTP